MDGEFLLLKENINITMHTTPEHNKRIANMIFASEYPHYVTKVKFKGRTNAELLQAIKCLTGFNEKNCKN